MSSRIMHQIVDALTTEARITPSPTEFELAYQVRVAIDRIKIAIRQNETFSAHSDQCGDTNLMLLDALDRLEEADRHFQDRCRVRRTRPHREIASGLGHENQRGAERP